jgi:hypothetical protein
MKKAIAASLVFLALVGYSVWNQRVLIPGSKLYVHTWFTQPRLWGNAVEFDHKGWAEICWTPDGKKVVCEKLKQASPR